MGGKDKAPIFVFDSDFPYDPNVTATFEDRASWIMWGGLATGAHLIPMLQDAAKSYSNYRDNSGTDLMIEYIRVYNDEQNIRETLDGELSKMLKSAEKIYELTGETKFEIIGELVGIMNGSTENWQKTLGAHQVYGYGDVTINKSTSTASINYTFRTEDMYNFNKGNADIASGVEDDKNGRFSTLGWAKEFKTIGEINSTETWELGDIGSNESGAN